MIFAASISLFECKFYMFYTPSVGSADFCLKEVVQNEASRQEPIALFPTGEVLLQVLEITRITTALKGASQILADRNKAKKASRNGRAVSNSRICLLVIDVQYEV